MNNSCIRILHVTEGHAKNDGGVTTVLNDLVFRLNRVGIYSCILAQTNNVEDVPDSVEFIPFGSQSVSFRSLFSKRLENQLTQIVKEKNINVIHIHGVWTPVQRLAAMVAYKLNIKFIITAHGMYEPWIWSGKGRINWLKKKIYFKFFACPAFKKAARFQAITPDEADNIKQLFPNASCALIPNAIDIDHIKYQPYTLKKVIYFIGRVNPKKGLDILLKAFNSLDEKESWSLIISGPNEVPSFKAELEEYIIHHGLGNRVQFTGPVYGIEKEKNIQEAWVTVVPSYSEVVGMVNLEASAFRCPTITTHQTGLYDWESGGGILVNPVEHELTAALQDAIKWSSTERYQRGESSYLLIEKKYSWDIVINKWVSLYSGVL